jgi:aminoglycoside phosphotransferase family enzyme/adenylate kinase family enzyme
MDQWHQQLLHPSTYPETTQSVGFKETHISRVYLTDQFAYKLKKPLNLGFLDFSTLEKRHHFCNEEVRLNRRFTKDIYLGVAQLRQQKGKVCFNNQGRLLDYAVKMRRLPEALMLDRLIETESPGLQNRMPQLGMALHTVMEQAETCYNEPVRNIEVVRRNSEENFAQTRAAIGSTLTKEAHELMHRAVEHDLNELEGLMLERERQGYVREGHGDLHAANICMTETICIYDCIEFNRRFRVADIVADLAFLIMDLEFRGRQDLANLLTTHYQSVSEDRSFGRLLPFYKQYRAWVRGKVDALFAVDPETTEETRQQAKQRASRYFNLALGYRLKPTLFLVSGLMGVGKTTLARALAQATGAKHLRSDVIRKQLAGLPEQQRSLDGFGTGLYSGEKTEQTYTAMFRAAEVALVQKHSLIIDASFASDEKRKRFITLAEQAGHPVWLLALQCPDAVALERLEQRVGDASDGRRDLYAIQKARFTAAEEANHAVAIDTVQPVDYNVQSFLCKALSSQEQLG